MSRIKPLILGPLLLCLGLVSACGSSKASAGLTIYSGQHEQTTAMLASAFERQTKIRVSVRSGDEATLGNQIVQEGPNSPADVFFAENTPVLEALREKDLLAPVASGTLASVPARYDAADGRWVGVSARASVLVYNTDRLHAGPLPSSILDLAKPPWSGKVGFAPSETDFQPLVSAIVKLDGAATAESWLKGLQASARIYSDNESVVNQVNSGQSELGAINSYYWYRLRAEKGLAAMHSALHYYNPGDPGDLVDVSGAAMLASSAHKAAAQEFLAFLVSRTGQQAIAHSQSYEYPLRPGVAAAAGLRPLSSLHSNSLTPAELGDASTALALEQKLGLL